MTIKQPSTYTAVGLPLAIFGETYVVISQWQPSGHLWSAEYNILTSRPQEQLFRRVVEFDTTDYPAELTPIDESYMEAEALRQAHMDLALRLEEWARQNGRMDLAYLPFTLQTTRVTPVTLWVRRIFPTTFQAMATQTQSINLKTYLDVVMLMKRLVPNTPPARGGAA